MVCFLPKAKIASCQEREAEAFLGVGSAGCCVPDRSLRVAGDVGMMCGGLESHWEGPGGTSAQEQPP